MDDLKEIIGRGIFRPYSVEKSLWKRLKTYGKADYEMSENVYNAVKNTLLGSEWCL